MFGIKGNSYLKATGGRGSFSSLENETHDFDHIINIPETERGMPSRLWCFGSFTRLVVFTHFYNRNHGEIFLKLSECVNFNASDCLNDQIKTRTSTQCETHLAALDMINSR